MRCYRTPQEKFQMIILLDTIKKLLLEIDIIRLRHIWLDFFKRAFGTELHAFTADNTFFFIDLRQGVNVLLRNSAFRTDCYGRTTVVLRTFFRVDCDSHIVLLSFILAIFLFNGFD